MPNSAYASLLSLIFSPFRLLCLSYSVILSGFFPFLEPGFVSFFFAFAVATFFEMVNRTDGNRFLEPILQYLWFLSEFQPKAFDHHMNDI